MIRWQNAIWWWRNSACVFSRVRRKGKEHDIACHGFMCYLDLPNTNTFRFHWTDSCCSYSCQREVCFSTSPFIYTPKRMRWEPRISWGWRIKLLTASVLSLVTEQNSNSVTRGPSRVGPCSSSTSVVSLQPSPRLSSLTSQPIDRSTTLEFDRRIPPSPG